jgi:hypothetical protein
VSVHHVEAQRQFALLAQPHVGAKGLFVHLWIVHARDAGQGEGLAVHGDDVPALSGQAHGVVGRNRVEIVAG